MTNVEPTRVARIWQLGACVLGLASMLVMYSTKNTLLSTALFCIMVSVVTLSLVQILGGMSKPVAAFLLPFLLVCFFLAAYLLRVMPYLGYLGQTMDALTQILLVTLLVAVPLLVFGQGIKVGGFGFNQLLAATQVLLIVAQLCVFGVSRWLPGWQARGLDVQIVQLDDAVLSAPLVEGQVAWLAQFSYQGNHALNQIDLSSGSVLRRIPLPNITPKELGQSGWMDTGFALRIWQTAISRINGHTLLLQYPTSFTLASNEPVEQPLSIRLTVDLDKGQVVGWQPLLGAGAQVGFVPGPDYLGERGQLDLQVGEYWVSWSQAELHFRSPTKHYFLRCAWPFYTISLDDKSMLMGTGSEFFIIKIK